MGLEGAAFAQIIACSVSPADRSQPTGSIGRTGENDGAFELFDWNCIIRIDLSV
jgi:hypothetical protein